MKLNAAKTIIAPTKATILGWIWINGTITASSHKMSPLVSCAPPSTATLLRSYIGSYKIFNKVLRGCAQYISELEVALTGKQKGDKIEWTDSLKESFRNAQNALSQTKSITLPKPEDQLIIVHDGSRVGIGSVLYLIRNGVMKLGGYFSAKLKSHQSRWLPCEIEALSVSTSVRHFAPYI